MILGDTAITKEINEADPCTFSDVVDKACEGLMSKQVKNSIRRLMEMESRLSALEQELDIFLRQKDGEPA